MFSNKIVFLVVGRTGSGKTTFCDKIESENPKNVKTVHVGKRLNEAALKKNNLRRAMDRGDLVLDSMVLGRFSSSDFAKKITLIDNYPSSLKSYFYFKLLITGFLKSRFSIVVFRIIRTPSDYDRRSPNFVHRRNILFSRRTLPMLNWMTRSGVRVIRIKDNLKDISLRTFI